MVIFSFQLPTFGPFFPAPAPRAFSTFWRPLLRQFQFPLSVFSGPQSPRSLSSPLDRTLPLKRGLPCVWDEPDTFNVFLFQVLLKNADFGRSGGNFFPLRAVSGFQPFLFPPFVSPRNLPSWCTAPRLLFFCPRRVYTSCFSCERRLSIMSSDLYPGYPAGSVPSFRCFKPPGGSISSPSCLSRTFRDIIAHLPLLLRFPVLETPSGLPSPVQNPRPPPWFLMSLLFYL